MTHGALPPSSHASSPQGDSAMHVSLAASGSGVDGGARPGSGVNKTGNLSIKQLSRLLRIVEDVTAAPNRHSGIEELVNAISVGFPNASVRCGIGRGRPKRIFDRRLGWLTSESSLFAAAETRWDEIPLDVPEGHLHGDSLVMCLPAPNGEGRCVLWIEGEGVSNSRHDWLLCGLQTIRVVLWKRPVRSWSHRFEKLGIGSTFWLALALSALFLIVAWPVPYRIACTAKVEPLQQRLVAAPFAAKLLQANIKPGDSVTAGQVLVVLDGRSLRIELDAIEAERQQASKEHVMAMATGRIADAQQARLKEQQLTHRKELISDRLSNLEVVSPIDGVIVSGDLDRYVGSPLETGQTLVEVAPLDRMTIEIEIPEHEIGYVTSESETKIRISAIGGRSIQMPLRDLYPSAEIRDDRNVFIGRVDVDNADGKLRPGMKGQATTYGPLRPLIWSSVRGAFERMLWWVGY